jgi:hypothetical protein
LALPLVDRDIVLKFDYRVYSRGQGTFGPYFIGLMIFLEFNLKCYSFILLAMGLGVKLISFCEKKKQFVKKIKF